MKAFEWLRRKVTAIKTMNGERLMKKEVVETDSLNAHPSALNSNGETLLVRAERYLWERYEFRYNVLAKCYEYREASAMSVSSLSLGEGGGRGRYFRSLDDEQKRYLLMQLQHAGINVPYVSHIQAIVDCGRAQRFNPVVDYLTHLPGQMGEVVHHGVEALSPPTIHYRLYVAHIRHIDARMLQLHQQVPLLFIIERAKIAASPPALSQREGAYRHRGGLSIFIAFRQHIVPKLIPLP